MTNKPTQVSVWIGLECGAVSQNDDTANHATGAEEECVYCDSDTCRARVFSLQLSMLGNIVVRPELMTVDCRLKDGWESRVLATLGIASDDEPTADTITVEQIEALKVAAGEHGDDELADICRVALGITPLRAWNLTPYAARIRCAEVLRETRARPRE